MKLAFADGLGPAREQTEEALPLSVSGTNNQVERFGAVNHIFTWPTVDELGDALFCFSEVLAAGDKEFSSVSQDAKYFKSRIFVRHKTFNLAYRG